MTLRVFDHISHVGTLNLEIDNGCEIRNKSHVSICYIMRATGCYIVMEAAILLGTVGGCLNLGGICLEP